MARRNEGGSPREDGLAETGGEARGAAGASGMPAPSKSAAPGGPRADDPVADAPAEDPAGSGWVADDLPPDDTRIEDPVGAAPARVYTRVSARRADAAEAAAPAAPSGASPDSQPDSQPQNPDQNPDQNPAERPADTPAGAAEAAPKPARKRGGKGGGGKRGKGRGKGKGKGKGPKPDAPEWTRWAALMLLSVCALRIAINAAPLIPLHFDEAQYWVYGVHFDFGYFSKPPLAAWLIRASTEVFGDTAFGVRFFAPIMHLLIGGFIHLIGARLFDARTGFWAAAFYTAGPGVVLSSMLMTTDPPMMVGWALALYAYIRAVEPVRIGRRKPQPAPFRPLWWALAGLGIGLGMMAKYTAAVAVIGMLGHLRFSAALRPAAPRKGLALMALVALLALSPNLIWQGMNGFVTIAHLGDNADMGGGGGPSVRPEKLAEFLGAQFGVIGPAAAAALFAGLAMLAWRKDWRGAPGVPLLSWFAAPLLLAIGFQALREGANPNWAAPAFVSGTVLAAHLLSGPRWRRARLLQVGAGGASALFLIAMGVVYGLGAQELPRKFDPYKKMRGGPEMCEIALSAMETEGADALLMDNRRRLSDCMFLGDLRMADVGFVDLDGRIDSHYDMAAPLRPGDRRAFVYLSLNPGAAEATAARFEEAELIDEGTIATHSDSAFSYVLWRVEGLPQE